MQLNLISCPRLLSCEHCLPLKNNQTPPKKTRAHLCKNKGLFYYALSFPHGRAGLLRSYAFIFRHDMGLIKEKSQSKSIFDAKPSSFQFTR